MNAKVLLPMLLACCLWAAALEATALPTESAAAVPDAKAAALVAAAQKRLDAGEVGAAEKLAEAALVLAPEKSKERKDAENLLAAVRVKSAAAEEVRLARSAQLEGKYPQAESHLRRALALLPPESPDLKKAENLLETVLEIRRQMAQLDEIERLLEERDYQTASKGLKELVPKAKDGRVVERADKLWKKSHPRWWPSVLGRLLKWFSDFGPYVVVIAPLVILLWFRRLYIHFLSPRLRQLINWCSDHLFKRRWLKDRWRLTEVADSTDLGIGKLIAFYLSYWSRQKPTPMTTGLLLLEASRIPLSPDLRVSHLNFDLAKELETVPLTIGGVKVGSVAKIFGPLSRWLKAGRQEIRGIAYSANERLIARLTAQYSVDRVVTVTASSEKTAPDAARAVADELAFKMLYTIASDGDTRVGGLATDLRDGLTLLESYVSGTQSESGERPWENLEKAQEMFERVRKASPESLEAHLYEGIALDLLERHEEAIGHFAHVKEKAKDDEETYHRAAYNEAIAHLRNLYQLEGIEECIRLVDQLTGPNPDFKASPIKALALAIKADAIACQPLHWKKVSNKKIFKQEEIASGKSRDLSLKRERVIQESIAGVTAITKNLREQLKELSKPTVRDSRDEQPEPVGGVTNQAVWDADALRQLEWAIHNAEGDLYLDCLLALANGDPATSPAKREKNYLKKALLAFRRCEMLLPAGVETLSNLGTLYLFRGKSGDLPMARRYLGRVINLNPNYEYAYLRLAQSWEKEHWREKVIEVLKKFPKPPGIGEFQAMYRKYYVQPKLDEASAEVDLVSPQKAQAPAAES